MGLRVTRLDDSSVEILAPLALNGNDKGTGFAGSLFTVAVLTGWSQAMLLLRDADLAGQVVISDTQVRYLKPATADFSAHSAVPPGEILQPFYRHLEARGRARLPLSIEVMSGDDVVLRFEGQYAALAESPVSRGR